MIKSENGLGKIKVTLENNLSVDLTWSLEDNRISATGSVTSQGSTVQLDNTFVLNDGNWRIDFDNLGAKIVENDLSPGTNDLTLAGYGSGIRVENGEILGDIFVLTTEITDQPTPAIAQGTILEPLEVE